MSHMITITGLEYHFTGPTAHLQRPVCIEDIAHHLALINRFHGATFRPYSVAEHSLLVQQIAAAHGESASVQLACLLHDAHESYTNDLASPAKRAVDHGGAPGWAGAWEEFEAEHAHTVRSHFGLLTTFASAGDRIRHYDLIALATERHYLTAYIPVLHARWACLRDGKADAIRPMLEIEPPCAGLTWRSIRAAFEGRFHELDLNMRQTAAALRAGGTA